MSECIGPIVNILFEHAQSKVTKYFNEHPSVIVVLFVVILILVLLIVFHKTDYKQMPIP